MVTECTVALEGTVPEFALVNVRIGINDFPKSMRQMVGPWALVVRTICVGDFSLATFGLRLNRRAFEDCAVVQNDSVYDWLKFWIFLATVDISVTFYVPVFGHHSLGFSEVYDIVVCRVEVRHACLALFAAVSAA